LITKGLISYDNEYEAMLFQSKPRDFYVKTKESEKVIHKRYEDADIMVIDSGLKLPVPSHLLHIIKTEEQFKEHFIDDHLPDEG